MRICLYFCVNIPFITLLVIGLYIMFTPNMTIDGVIIETPGTLQCYHLCPYMLSYTVHKTIYNTSLICQSCNKNNTKVTVYYNSFQPSEYDLDKGLGERNIGIFLVMIGGMWSLMFTFYVHNSCYNARSTTTRRVRDATVEDNTPPPPPEPEPEPAQINLETISVQTSNIQLGVAVTEDNKIITRIIQQPR
jgi:hypothetical protein